MSKYHFLLLGLVFAFGWQTLEAQNYYSGKFRIQSYTHYGYTYTLYDFNRTGAKMKAIAANSALWLNLVRIYFCRFQISSINPPKTTSR